MHICCAPCAIYPFEVLKQKGFEVCGFFYNPNIQPHAEYIRRQEAALDFGKRFGVEIMLGAYDEERYRECSKGCAVKSQRCKSCFELRLRQTQLTAGQKRFDFFTTTLLVSPYQDQSLIEEIGTGLSQGSSAQFLTQDFRPGFRQAHKQARGFGWYMQKYCGCLASLQEREHERSLKKAAQC